MLLNDTTPYVSRPASRGSSWESDGRESRHGRQLTWHGVWRVKVWSERWQRSRHWSRSRQKAVDRVSPVRQLRVLVVFASNDAGRVELARLELEGVKGTRLPGKQGQSRRQIQRKPLQRLSPHRVLLLVEFLPIVAVAS